MKFQKDLENIYNSIGYCLTQYPIYYYKSSEMEINKTLKKKIKLKRKQLTKRQKKK